MVFRSDGNGFQATFSMVLSTCMNERLATQRGVHFFRPVPKEYLHSAELRDIMQFGSSSQAVFFKMRVAGVLHIFQFDTRQGEDICMALQTHINDIMMKRYSKVRCTTRQRPAAARLCRISFCLLGWGMCQSGPCMYSGQGRDHSRGFCAHIRLAW